MVKFNNDSFTKFEVGKNLILKKRVSSNFEGFSVAVKGKVLTLGSLWPCGFFLLYIM